MPGKCNFILVATDGKAFDVEFGKLAGLVDRKRVAGEDGFVAAQFEKRGEHEILKKSCLTLFVLPRIC